MRLRIKSVLGVLLILMASIASAETPEQNCQATKNLIAGTYANCLHEAQYPKRKTALRASSASLSGIRRCKNQFNSDWQEIIDQTTKSGASCFDAAQTGSYFREEIDAVVQEVATLLGKFVKLGSQASTCRATKNRIAGSYLFCRQKAESRFARNEDSSKYDALISLRCESQFEKDWNKIIRRTRKAGAQCYDDALSSGDFKSILDEHSNQVAEELSGNRLTLTGSPLVLTAGGASGNLTITNSSTKIIATNIASNFTGTALAGKVTESVNSCSRLVPGASCILTFSPGNSSVAETSFLIQGSNTLPVTASISIVNETTPTISVSGAPLSLTVNGSAGDLTITNLSVTTTATNISSDFSGTALDGNVTETGNTCASLAPGSTCTLTFTPGSSLVSVTDFDIQGSNTLPVVSSIEVRSGSTLLSVSPSSGSATGGAGVTLSGTGFTGATSVTFGGIAATSVNVVNSTTITAVTPAHAVGAVDVVIDTPAGGATLVNGYTYETTAVGQAVQGGTIACLNGGLQNLIASSSDNSSGMEFGGSGVAVGVTAQSDSDGASNSAAIITSVGVGSYAASLCDSFEVDSQGNTPCQVGNICYNDWFLPAKDQLGCLYSNNGAIGGFGGILYWTSTESAATPEMFSWVNSFHNGMPQLSIKNVLNSVRCVRSFVP